MRHVARDARRLLTLDVPCALASDLIEGSIVRLRPREGTDPDVLEGYRQQCVDAGAVAVKVLPCPPRGEVVIAETKQPRRTLRQVVTAMVDEARGVDTDALRDMVEGVMAEENL